MKAQELLAAVRSALAEASGSTPARRLTAQLILAAIATRTEAQQISRQDIEAAVRIADDLEMILGIEAEIDDDYTIEAIAAHLKKYYNEDEAQEESPSR